MCYALHTDVNCISQPCFNLKLGNSLFTFTMKFRGCPTHMHVLGAILKCMNSAVPGVHTSSVAVCLSPPSLCSTIFTFFPAKFSLPSQ